MIRYLKYDELLDLHRWALQEFGGLHGIRDQGLIESALAAPKMTFDGADLYPSLVEKAAALAFSLVKNHAFHDGNKRVGYAAMGVFLRLNEHQLTCNTEEGTQTFLAIADGKMGREMLAEWLSAHCAPMQSGG